MCLFYEAYITCSCSTIHDVYTMFILTGMSLKGMHLTCSYKVTVQRVCSEVITDRHGCSHQGLADDLPPEETAAEGDPVVLPPA